MAGLQRSLLTVHPPRPIPQRPLGATGLPVSVLGFGGAPIGFSADIDEGAADALIRRAVDLGVTFFDTAPDYRRSEELLRRALRGRRSAVILATKVGRLQTSSARGWEVREDWTEADAARARGVVHSSGYVSRRAWLG